MNDPMKRNINWSANGANTVFASATFKSTHNVAPSSAVSGIGNAYSDEILHAAKLSPLKLTRRLTDEEIDADMNAIRNALESSCGATLR